ncbi:hypothetical protein [Altericista sp. CCNU0014]|uniref:hypothetical protein n=1 Tax=Altericista sp. CCNU0014 TaxID=3082949 RepID=UPI00384B55AA
MIEAISNPNATDIIQTIYADSHVHIHSCFDLDLFLDAALANFLRVGHDGDIFILFLTESSSESYFQNLYRSALTGTSAVPSLKRWSVRLTGDDSALYAACPTSTSGIYMIAGKQIVTLENLEVLALMTTAAFEDRQPLERVVNAVSERGGIPVIPWGVGKWMGRRGRILRQFLDRHPRLFLGDNSGRPVFWLEPLLFRQAKAQGGRVLPGSDPLPFPSECWRPGSFGFSMAGVGIFDSAQPAVSLKQTLFDSAVQLKAYGALENPYRFTRNQLEMQLIKYLKPKR